MGVVRHDAFFFPAPNVSLWFEKNPGQFIFLYPWGKNTCFEREIPPRVGEFFLTEVPGPFNSERGQNFENKETNI